MDAPTTIWIPRRQPEDGLTQARAEALEAAQQYGLTGEPKVETYDGLHHWYGELSDPQGYRFTWGLPETE